MTSPMVVVRDHEQRDCYSPEFGVDVARRRRMAETVMSASRSCYRGRLEVSGWKDAVRRRLMGQALLLAYRSCWQERVKMTGLKQRRCPSSP